MLCTNGRISWPVVSGILFSTIAILLTDIVWRVVQISIWAIAASAIALLIIGNATIFIVSSRSLSFNRSPAEHNNVARPNQTSETC